MPAVNHHTFVRWWEANRPAWGARFQRFTGTFALVSDMLSEGARLAVRARTLQNDTPPDHLPLLGAARLLPQLPFESEARYRQTLEIGPWFYHPRAGSPQSVLEHLARMDELYVPGTLDPITWDIDEAPAGYAPEDFAYTILLTNVPAATYNGSYVYGVDAPPYDGSWCYGTKLPAYIVRAIVDVCAEWGRFSSKLVGLECTG